MNADVIDYIAMNSPVVTPALNLDTDRTNPGRSRISVFGMIFVDVIDNVADDLTLGRASIAIDTGVFCVSLIWDQAIFTFLMIVHDIVANNITNTAV